MLSSKDNSRPSTTSDVASKQKGKKENAVVDYQDANQKIKRQKDLERLGLFSDIGYLKPNVYVPKDKDLFLHERCKGRQLITAPSRKGRFDNQSYFNKDFIHIFEKDAYCDYVLVRRKYRLAQKVKEINPKSSFVPSNSTHKPCGKGSLYGTFEHEYPMFKNDLDEFYKTADMEKKGEKGRNIKSAPVEHLKNFVTAPPKHGTGYGYVDVTIGAPFMYEPSPFDLPRELEQKERLRNQALCISKRPFISASRSIDVFDPTIYSDTITDPKKGKKDELTKPALEAINQKRKKSLPPFRPTNPAKSGIFGTFDAYPKSLIQSSSRESVSAPASGKRFQGYSRSAGATNDADVKPKSIFRPSGGFHSFPIRSIALMNVPKVPILFQDSQGKYVSTGFRRKSVRDLVTSNSEKRTTSKESLAFALPVAPNSLHASGTSIKASI